VAGGDRVGAQVPFRGGGTGPAVDLELGKSAVTSAARAHRDARAPRRALPEPAAHGPLPPPDPRVGGAIGRACARPGSRRSSRAETEHFVHVRSTGSWWSSERRARAGASARSGADKAQCHSDEMITAWSDALTRRQREPTSAWGWIVLTGRGRATTFLRRRRHWLATRDRRSPAQRAGKQYSADSRPRAPPARAVCWLEVQVTGRVQACGVGGPGIGFSLRRSHRLHDRRPDDAKSSGRPFTERGSSRQAGANPGCCRRRVGWPSWRAPRGWCCSGARFRAPRPGRLGPNPRRGAGSGRLDARSRRVVGAPGVGADGFARGWQVGLLHAGGRRESPSINTCERGRSPNASCSHAHRTTSGKGMAAFRERPGPPNFEGKNR